MLYLTPAMTKLPNALWHALRNTVNSNNKPKNSIKQLSPMSGGSQIRTSCMSIAMLLSELILCSKNMSSFMSVLLAPGPLRNWSILHITYVPISKENPVGHKEQELQYKEV